MNAHIDVSLEGKLYNDINLICHSVLTIKANFSKCQLFWISIGKPGKINKVICGHKQKMYMFIKLVFVPTDDNCLPAYKGNWIGFKDAQIEGNCVLFTEKYIVFIQLLRLLWGKDLSIFLK